MVEERRSSLMSSLELLPPGARILAISEIGGGTAPTFSHSVGDKIGASSEILICTLDADAAATGMIWIEYILD
jgi:hypothetical protein